MRPLGSEEARPAHGNDTTKHPDTCNTTAEVRSTGGASKAKQGWLQGTGNGATSECKRLDLHRLQQGQVLWSQVSWAGQPLLPGNDQTMVARFRVRIINHHTVLVHLHLRIFASVSAAHP